MCSVKMFRAIGVRCKWTVSYLNGYQTQSCAQCTVLSAEAQQTANSGAVLARAMASMPTRCNRKQSTATMRLAAVAVPAIFGDPTLAHPLSQRRPKQCGTLFPRTSQLCLVLALCRYSYLLGSLRTDEMGESSLRRSSATYSHPITWSTPPSADDTADSSPRTSSSSGPLPIAWLMSYPVSASTWRQIVVHHCTRMPSRTRFRL